ncbi:MAG: asparagine synthetase B family protein [Allosphingosinicella sp.]
MTALAGLWGYGDSPEPAAACARMLKAQRLYGPEAPASAAEGEVALGRALYPLLPEDRFDRGPVRGGGGRFLLAADVRLDDREGLADALGIGAGEAAALADSALVMRAFERWEEAALDRLAGDFALALWDGARRRLLLARDPFAQRPLHYHRGPGFFAFASMPKGLHALAEIPPAPDRQAMADFIALLPETGSESFFAGIEKVRGGHVVEVGPGGLVSRRYWHPPSATLRLKRPDDYAEAMREQMDRAVAARLRGCGGRVASQLSAGLDSSTVTATAARLLTGEGGRVTAFTAVPRPGFPDPGLRGRFADEGPLAAEVAALYANVEHVRVPGDGRSPLAGLDRAFFLYERPYLNLCNGTWVDAIMDEARARRHRVMLGAILGNATFSYSGLHALPRLLRQGRLVRLLREARLLLRGGSHWEGVAAAALGPFVPRRLWRAILRARGRERALTGYSAIHPTLAEDPALLRRAAERGLDLSYRPRADSIEARLSLLEGTDFGNYNKGTLAGWGIDYRDPAADRRLIELCLSFPPEAWLGDGRPRGLARQMLDGRVPPEVTSETRRGFQAADWHEALTASRARLREEIERLEAVPAAAGALDLPRLKRLVEQWPEEGWERIEVRNAYRLALLRGAAAGHFLRKASGSNA